MNPGTREIKLRSSKIIPVIFLVCFTCTSHSIKKSGFETSAPPNPVKGFKLVGIMGEGKLGSAYLRLPTGIAIDFQGNVFITDTGNDRVVKCDDKGRFLTEIGGFGRGAGEFNRPTYLATDNGLNIYVMDSQNKRIQRLDANLNFVSVIEIKETGDSPGFGLPDGIAITSSGEIVVSDAEDDRLIKLNSYFEYDRSIGSFENMEAGLRDPLGVVVSRNGDFYVADSRNHRVAVFDAFGNFLRSFGEGILKNPNGVTVDEDNLIYVANTGENSLVVFDPKGDVLLEYESLGLGITNLSGPTDLKFGKDGRLIVVDSKNNRFLAFEILR